MAEPSIKVLGLYSPKANPDLYDAFIAAEVESRDPRNFSDEVRAVFYRLGRADDLQPLTDDGKAEIAERLDMELGSAVLVEVWVVNADARFDVGDFKQASTSQPEGFWQVAWDERYLSADGSSVIAEGSPPPLKATNAIRVVFYIHYWQSDQPLLTSYGPVPLPSVEPMPERLWKLAPYREVD